MLSGNRMLSFHATRQLISGIAVTMIPPLSSANRQSNLCLLTSDF